MDEQGAIWESAPGENGTDDRSPLPPLTGPSGPTGPPPEMPVIEGDAPPMMPPLRARIVPNVEVGDPNPTDETRDRYIGDERQRQIDNREKYLHDPAYSNAPENHPGRLKSFGTGALLSAGQAADDILAGSRHSGQPVTWGEVGQIAAGAFGGGAAGAVKPKLIADLEHQSEIARLKGEQAEERVKRQQAIDEAAKRAAIGLDVAKANDLNAQNKPQAKERDQLIGIWKDLDEFSPESNPELAQRWQTAFGYPAPSKTKGDQTQIVNTDDGYYQVNKKDRTATRIDGIPDTRRTMIFGGQTFKVTDAQAVNALALSGREGTATANANAGFEQKYEEDETARKQKLANKQTEVRNAQSNMERLGQRQGELAAQKQTILAKPEDKRDLVAIDNIDREYQRNAEDIQKSQDTFNSATTDVQTLSTPTPKRTPNQAPPAGTVSRPTQLTGRDAAKKYLKSQGVPDDKLDTAVDEYMRAHQ